MGKSANKQLKTPLAKKTFECSGWKKISFVEFDVCQKCESTQGCLWREKALIMYRHLACIGRIKVISFFSIAAIKSGNSDSDMLTHLICNTPLRVSGVL